MKNLTVIGEVFIDTVHNETVNRSVNEILESYTRHFNTVHYIGPGKEEITYRKTNIENLYISTIKSYNKTLKGRLKYYINQRKVKKRYKNLFKKSETDIVQIRIPSLFTITAYSTVQDMHLPLTTYIAGDWQTSFSANYNFKGSKYIAKKLDKMQYPLIKNSIPVTAGPILAEKYNKLNKCHTYYSTTHNKIYEKKLENPLNLIYVGRLEPLKRVEDLINSVEILVKNKYNIKLRILGDGIMKKELEKLVEQKKLEEHICFLGNIKNKETVKKEYMRANILVLPSLSEGTPKVLPEAMAHSVIPIAVKDVGSINYIIQNNINGILVPKKSPESIAKSIDWLNKDREAHKFMLNGVKQYAIENTLDKEVDKLWNYVKKNIKRTKW